MLNSKEYLNSIRFFSQPNNKSFYVHFEDIVSNLPADKHKEAIHEALNHYQQKHELVRFGDIIEFDKIEVLEHN
jgi:hypothetical protein